MAIGVAKENDNIISSVTTSPCGRAILIAVDVLDGLAFGLMNMFGPNSTMERTSLWDTVDADRP